MKLPQKIVIASRTDFDWACTMIAQHDLCQRCDVVLSPVAGQLNPTDLAEWILAAGLDVGLDHERADGLARQVQPPSP